MPSLVGPREHHPDEPEWADLNLRDTTVQKAMAYQRHLTAQRIAETKERNKALRTRDLPRLVDPATGEVPEEGIKYTEGRHTVTLPVGMRPEHVSPPACHTDFAQICRGPFRSVLDHLCELRLTGTQRLLWAVVVVEADPTGVVNMTAAEAGRRLGIKRPAAYKAMKALEVARLVRLTTTPGSRDHWIEILNYDEVVKIDLDRRVRNAEERLRRRVIEREVTTVRERVVEEYQ